MSLAIDVDCVTHVLLVDGWHEVAGQSFTVAPYEYGHIVPTGVTNAPNFVFLHQAGYGGVCPVGFDFTDAATGASMCGRISSVVAVRRSQSW